jgi:hypothetical protein
VDFCPRLPGRAGQGFNDGVASIMDLPAGLYRGRVEGRESGSCEARLEVRPVPGGCLAVDYEAVGPDGLQHVEHTVVSPDALHVAHSEGVGVEVFTRTADGVFDGPDSGPYRQRLAVAWDGAELLWSWHWAPLGQEPQEQSRAVLRPAAG